jgi:hypothetical protein
MTSIISIMLNYSATILNVNENIVIVDDSIQGRLNFDRNYSLLCI